MNKTHYARYFTIVLLAILVLGGCKSKKTTVSKRQHPKRERVVKKPPTRVVIPKKEESNPTVVVESKKNASYTEVVSDYVTSYHEIASEEMLQYGIPASITLAQGILESGAGRGELSQRANNHFGIKCHSQWTGERVYHDDDELQECFRKYKDPKYSYRDHSLFLTQRSRYQDLFKLNKSDYKGWARGLRKAGYATDPKYPDKLIGIIERYNLTQYDQAVLGKPARASAPDEDKISTYTVQQGDTLYAISRRFSVSVDTLKEYNGLVSNDISIGQVLYLHATKN